MFKQKESKLYATFWTLSTLACHSLLLYSSPRSYMYSYLCHLIHSAGEPSHLPYPFSYGFIKKCNARDIIDEQLRRQKCSPAFIGVSLPSQQAPTSTLTTQRELQMNLTPLLLLPQSSCVAHSGTLFSILNLQFFTSDVLNS